MAAFHLNDTFILFHSQAHKDTNKNVVLYKYIGNMKEKHWHKLVSIQESEPTLSHVDSK
jgi:hypothetical protein